MADDSAPEPALPTGVQYDISAGGYRAVITELGATLRSLSSNCADLICGFGAAETISSGRGQQLIPWPNRIRDGRYRIDDVDYQLALSEPDRHNAMHGLVRWTGWRLVSHEPSSVTLQHTVFPQKGWPTVLESMISYRLSSDGLQVDVQARNLGDHRVPFGYGAHPFLTAGESSVDELSLTLPADRYLQVDDRMLPTELVEVDERYDFREQKPVAGLDLDTAYSDLHRDDQGRWRVSIACGSRRTSLWADERHRWAQVFTGGGDRTTGLAVEPMTCGPDAFNPGPTTEGVVSLEPGQSYQGHWGIQGE